jgi:uncharacterized ferritin-like protein (DUF455 family)
VTADARDPRLFAEGSVRDERFTVRDAWHEMYNFSWSDAEATREFLHRQMSEEINGMEISARNLADFPDAPWELRMAMARQCWDESRHVQLFRRACEKRGGYVGQYPVLNFQYRIIMRIDNLVGRLAVQNRSFEGAGIDALDVEVARVREAGEEDLQELFDVQLADEVQHVRYGNEWVHRLVEEGGPLATFQVARAVAQASEALEAVAGNTLLRYKVADGVRREAGFEEDEIEAVRSFPNERIG